MDLATRYRVRGRSPSETEWSRWYYISDSEFTYKNFHLDGNENEVGTWRWEVQSGAYGSDSFSDATEMTIYYPGPASESSRSRETSGRPVEYVDRKFWEGVRQEP